LAVLTLSTAYMKKHTDSLEPYSFYHVLNRGVNGEQIFKQERNYAYFLEKYAYYIEPIAQTYAYVLMGNHFHFMIRTKTEAAVRAEMGNKYVDWTVQKIFSNQFAKFFNGYVQAINNQENRTGTLLEEPFRRIPVETDSYLLHLVYYIHFNPQKHRFIIHFKNYPHSSYHAFLSNQPTRLARDEVFDWFGGLEGFLKYHDSNKGLGDEWLQKCWDE
jgi:putative transposase